MNGSEELREVIVELQRETALLRTEASHATLLLNALEALLSVEQNEEPFSSVFGALKAVFNYSHVLVLSESEEGEDALRCIVSSESQLVGEMWPLGSFFRKVLGGRVSATVSNGELDEWRGSRTGLQAGQPGLYLPMKVRDRRGLMMILRDVGRHGFSRSDVALARKFALLASHALAARHASQSEAESQRLRDLTQRLQDSQSELAFRANYDSLTGLPNRTAIEERVKTAVNEATASQQVGVAFVDLDHFKRINDLYSHHVGDELLKQVADRIRNCLRATDAVGRISGDEFVIVIDPLTGRGELTEVIDGILRLFERPFEIEQAHIQISASIGIALSPDHGRHYDELRRHADTAMYHAKVTAKGTAAFFDEGLGKQAAERLALEPRLRKAVRERQFRCAFQPKVNLATLRVESFEALVRWVDETGIVHAPGEFIDLASELGLLGDITMLVAEETSGVLPTLMEIFGKDVCISMNVSAKQASDPVFMEALVLRLAQTQHPKHLMLELTEDAIVAAGVFQARTLPLLRQIGVQVSIDDFGTGYSSLAALSDITADELKVDRSIVRLIHQRPRSQSILKAIVSLSEALGMSVVAEGIELREELDYLLSATSIRLGQGYLFSKPLFIEDLTEWASSGQLRAA